MYVKTLTFCFITIGVVGVPVDETKDQQTRGPGLFLHSIANACRGNILTCQTCLQKNNFIPLMKCMMQGGGPPSLPDLSKNETEDIQTFLYRMLEIGDCMEEEMRKGAIIVKAMEIINAGTTPEEKQDILRKMMVDPPAILMNLRSSSASSSAVRQLMEGQMGSMDTMTDRFAQCMDDEGSQ